MESVREVAIARRARKPEPPSPAASLRAGEGALLAAAFLGAALVLYGPALDGPFVSDDNHYVAQNTWVHGLGSENVLEILKPFGAATVAVVNYAPVHLLLHASAWELFGADVRGHHVVNVVLHSVASLLLIPLLMSAGIPRAAAILGGAVFLVHPANVEAVAWISQLKSSSSMLLSLASLLVFPRRPALGTALFALALLAKPTAAFVLPVVVLILWARREPMPGRWLAVSAGVFAAYAVFELATHQRSGAAAATLYAAPLSLLGTIAALIPRYLVMASTSLGLSAFHEPDPVRTLLDPWWLASVPVLGLLGWRLVVVLRGRREEAAWWIWALVSYGPVSPLFPFLYQLADRYLYFMLPGLIGAGLLAGRDALDRLPEARRSAPVRVALALGIGMVLVFAWRSHDRAVIWSSPARLVADAAAHYPEGVSAHLLRAKRAAQVGDADGSVVEMRGAVARGYNRYEQLMADPAYAPVRSTPQFQALVSEIAAGWIESGRRKPNPTQLELRQIAFAHAVRGEYAEASEVLRRALDLGDRYDEQIRADLDELSRRY